MKNEEIKFRCWDKKMKKIYPIESIYFYNDGIRVWVIDGKGITHNLQPNELILMQYTGSKDKKLCQHDIIEYPFEHPITDEEEIHKGVIEKDDYGFRVETLDGSSSFSLENLDEVMNGVKIIGNIHENHSLLK